MSVEFNTFLPILVIDLIWYIYILCADGEYLRVGKNQVQKWWRWGMVNNLINWAEGRFPGHQAGPEGSKPGRCLLQVLRALECQPPSLNWKRTNSQVERAFGAIGHVYLWGVRFCSHHKRRPKLAGVSVRQAKWSNADEFSWHWAWHGPCAQLQWAGLGNIFTRAGFRRGPVEWVWLILGTEFLTALVRGESFNGNFSL